MVRPLDRGVSSGSQAPINSSPSPTQPTQSSAGAAPSPGPENQQEGSTPRVSEREARERTSEFRFPGQLREAQIRGQLGQGKDGTIGQNQGGTAPEQVAPADRITSPPGEIRERNRILNHMLRGVDPSSLSSEHRDRILRSMDAFSLRQLRSMDRAGVRIWAEPNTVPPEYSGRHGNVMVHAGSRPPAGGYPAEVDTVVEVPPLDAVAEYQPQFRTIRINPHNMNRGSAVDDVRHELAHAWDDVRNDQNSRPLDRMPERQRFSEIVRRAEQTQEGGQFGSESEARVGPAGLTMQQMFARYGNATPLREMTFVNPGTSERHAARNPREFYAEGYSVFHGSHLESQARMLRYAPDLFNYLEQESQQNGLPVPDRARLQQLLQDPSFH